MFQMRHFWYQKDSDLLRMSISQQPKEILQFRKRHIKLDITALKIHKAMYGYIRFLEFKVTLEVKICLKMAKNLKFFKGGGVNLVSEQKDSL